MIVSTEPAPRRKGLHRQLYAQVLAAITLGALIGHFWPQTGEAM
jgi:aerobic C4-dicarboxylate transport protein